MTSSLLFISLLVLAVSAYEPGFAPVPNITSCTSCASFTYNFTELDALKNFCATAIGNSANDQGNKCCRQLTLAVNICSHYWLRQPQNSFLEPLLKIGIQYCRSDPSPHIRLDGSLPADDAFPYPVEYDTTTCFGCDDYAVGQPTRDEDETDVDCGGSNCPARCGAFARCKVDGDCEENVKCTPALDVNGDPILALLSGSQSQYIEKLYCVPDSLVAKEDAAVDKSTGSVSLALGSVTFVLTLAFVAFAVTKAPAQS